MRRPHTGGHNPSRLRLPHKIVAASSEKNVDATTHRRSQKFRPCCSHRLGRVDRKLRIHKASLNLRAPRPPCLGGPVPLKRRTIGPFDDSRDLTRPAHHSPIHRDATTRPCPIPRLKPPSELLTSGLVVRSNDDHRVVRYAEHSSLRPQCKRQGDRRHQRREDADLL